MEGHRCTALLPLTRTVETDRAVLPAGESQNVELMTLLSRLVVDFPAMEDAASAIVLTDDSGHVIHQSGQLKVSAERRPLSQLTITGLLPHWNMEIYMDESRQGAARVFFYLSMILVGIFIAAILSGGILLTRLINNVLDFGKLEQGQKHYRLTSVSEDNRS